MKYLGLHALFWLCFLVNLIENQNSIMHGMVMVVREPDLVLSPILLVNFSELYRGIVGFSNVLF